MKSECYYLISISLHLHTPAWAIHAVMLIRVALGQLATSPARVVLAVMLIRVALGQLATSHAQDAPPNTSKRVAIPARVVLAVMLIRVVLGLLATSRSQTPKRVVHFTPCLSN